MKPSTAAKVKISQAIAWWSANSRRLAAKVLLLSPILVGTGVAILSGSDRLGLPRDGLAGSAANFVGQALLLVGMLMLMLAIHYWIPWLAMRLRLPGPATLSADAVEWADKVLRANQAEILAAAERQALDEASPPPGPGAPSGAPKRL